MKLLSEISDKLKKYTVGNLLFIFVILLILIFHIILWAKLSYVCALSSDNLVFGLFDEQERFFDSLINPFTVHGGGYTALFLTKFFTSQFSRMLGLHVADTVGVPLGIVKGIFFSILIFFFTKYSLIFHKSKKLFLFVYVFISLFFYINLYSVGAEWLIYDNNNFFRYLFPLIFYFIYFPYLFNYIINSKMNSKFVHPLLFLVVCNIFLGTNLEIISVQVISFYLILFVYNLIFKYCLKCNVKGILFSLNHNIVISFVSICAFFLLFMFSPGTRTLLNERVSFNVDFFEYLHNWSMIIFKDNIIYNLLLFIVFIIAFFIAKRRKEINKILFVLFIYISLLAALFSLIFTQKQGVLYLENGRTCFVFQLIFLYLFFQLLSYILKYISYKKLFCTIVSAILLFSSVYSVFYIYQNFQKYKNVSNIYLLEKKKNYVQEKIARFYDIKNETLYLDSNYLNVTDEYCNLWSPSISSNSDLFVESCFNSSSNFNMTNYYSFVYNKFLDSQICFKQDAIEKFYNNGGYFTKEELSHIRFNNLLNDNFITNTYGKKIRKEEVLKLMNEPVRKTED